MFSQRRLVTAALTVWFSLCSTENVNTAPESMITAAPAIPKRDLYSNNDFVGYFSTLGSYYYSTCSGYNYDDVYMGGAYYGGCQTGYSMTIFTACHHGSVYGSSWYSTYSATKYNADGICVYGCITDYLWAGAGHSTSYFVQCDTSRLPHTFYRMPSDSLPGASPAIQTESSPYCASCSDIVTPTTPQPISSPTGPDSIPPRTKTKKPPAGKIAGGVIGGLAILASAVVGFWFFMKKRRAAKANNHGQSLPVLVEQPIYPSGGGPPVVAVPEKVVISSAAPTSPYPYPQPQQQWGPNPNNGPPHTVSPPGSPPPPQQWDSNMNNGPLMVSPPGSPPPPQYFPPQPQPIGYQQPYQPGSMP